MSLTEIARRNRLKALASLDERNIFKNLQEMSSSRAGRFASSRSAHRAHRFQLHFATTRSA